MNTIPWTLLLLSLPLAYSSCFYDRLKFDFNEASGDLDVYCKYGPVKIPFGQKHKDNSNCLRCTCDKYGLSCCGFGMAAGSMMVYPPCKIKRIGNCDYDVVRIDNENVKC